MMKKVPRIAFLILMTLGSSPTFCPQAAERGLPPEVAFAPHVSPVHLIARPDSYDGKLVRATGFLHTNFEDSALYLSKDEADYLGNTAIWVTYAPDCQFEPLYPRGKSNGQPVGLNDFNGKWVELLGRFNKNHHGHMDAFSGSLEDVSHVRESQRYYDGSKGR